MSCAAAGPLRHVVRRRARGVRARAWVLIGTLSLSACAERRAPPRPPLREVCAPVPQCPSWIEAFRANRPPLHIYAYDGISTTPACSHGQSVRVTAFLDDAPVGIVEVPCLDEVRAPPPSYRIDAPPVEPGMHELRIDVQTPRGVVQGSTLLSLPAFDLPSTGNSVVFGSEIAVGVGPDDLAIGPPQVYPPKGL